MTNDDEIALKVKESSKEVAVRSQSFKSLIDRFISSLDVSARSRSSYRFNIKLFFEWMSSNQVVDPNRDTILAYKRHLQARELSTFTISAYLTAVRLFFEWAEGHKIYPNIAKGVKDTKKPHGHQKDALTQEQLKALLKSIDKGTLQGVRDFAIINLLARTGLRTIEVIRANEEDIRNIEGKVVLFVHGKGRDSRDEPIILTEGAYKPIREYLGARGPLHGKAALFTSLSRRNLNERLTTNSISRLVKSAFRAIGIDSSRITAHSLRHSAITMVLDGGGSILQAQVLGRHSNIATTMIYLHKKNRLQDSPEEVIAKLFDDDEESK